jgi:hypothetical protein
MADLVIIESPLAGDFERNIRYARWCMFDCLMRGEAPFASHLLYPQCLDDRDPGHRKLGIEAGFAWGELARHVYYIDLCCERLVDDCPDPGARTIAMARTDITCWSRGMLQAWHRFGGEIRTLTPRMLDAFENGESPGATPAATEVNP